MKIKIVTKTESGYLCEDPEGIGSSMWRIYPSEYNGDDFNQIECDELIKNLTAYATHIRKEDIVSVEAVTIMHGNIVTNHNNDECFVSYNDNEQIPISIDDKSLTIVDNNRHVTFYIKDGVAKITHKYPKEHGLEWLSDSTEYPAD